MELGGFADQAFGEVRDRFAASFEHVDGSDPPELGAAVAVWHDGELLVDLWGGWRDFERENAWSADTVTWLWSCRKALSGLAIHALVDRGLVDYDDAVSRFWPEFANGGKANITIAHVLSHQAGLTTPPAVDGPLTFEAVIRAIEAASPEWEPGTSFGYSGTIDWIVEEVVHRVTGERLNSWFDREVTRPVGVELFLTLPESERDRLASPFSPDGNRWDAPVWWPDNAYATARSAAQLFGLLARDRGEVISSATLARSLEVRAEGVDRTNGHPRAYRLGWRKSAGPGDVQIGSDGFGAPGGFGSVVWADRQRRIGFAFLRNLCAPPKTEYRANELLGAALKAASTY